MDGINRLAKLLKKQKDKYLNIIVNYLMLQTELNEAFLNEEKNLKDMATYIRDLAKKQATNNVAVIEDSVVFQWAKNYFLKTNEELGIKKVKLEKAKQSDTKKIEVKDDEFGSIFNFDDRDNTLDNNDKKEKIEQISLFAA
mgnify:CR=1 FL=1